ncbi:hypothetical protein DM860_000286 [Cuscuta australis]|uniref:Reverse transcriptase zinc-binding domain-containing protein n=1 Tax=Cuscuta australis TaxID=267555 RepID=A0A328CW38_9ASTE|nr:hypothetical protein DM860_000286 [Cuscuta australis]
MRVAEAEGGGGGEWVAGRGGGGSGKGEEGEGGVDYPGACRKMIDGCYWGFERCQKDCNEMFKGHNPFAECQVRGRLQTKQRLSRFLIIDNGCVLCDSGNEDINHLFWKCDYANCIFGSIMTSLGCEVGGESPQEFCSKYLRKGSRKQKMVWRAVWAAICYSIWRARTRKFSQERILK